MLVDFGLAEGIGYDDRSSYPSVNNHDEDVGSFIWHMHESLSIIFRINVRHV
jgi:hypothetical protein